MTAQNFTLSSPLPWLVILGLFLLTPLSPAYADPVVFETTKGEITLTLHAKQSPRASQLFLDMVKSGSLNGVTMGLIVRDTLIHLSPTPAQKPPAGDSPKPSDKNPLPHIQGSVAWTLPPEKLRFAGSFFINLRANPMLNGTFPVFAQVSQGAEQLSQLTHQDRILYVTIIQPNRGEIPQAILKRKPVSVKAE